MWRQEDRSICEYPKTNFPNLSVIIGGYSNFVRFYPDLCTANGGYIKMSDERFKLECSEKFSISCKERFLINHPDQSELLKDVTSSEIINHKKSDEAKTGVIASRFDIDVSKSNLEHRDDLFLDIPKEYQLIGQCSKLHQKINNVFYDIDNTENKNIKDS